MRPFIAQLQLAKSQYKALCAADTAVAKLSFVRGGFYILQALHNSWLRKELSEGLAGSGRDVASIAASLDVLSDTDNALPQSLHLLQNSDWYADFRTLLTALADPTVMDGPGASGSATDAANVIASAKTVSLDADSLRLCLLGFERYFDALLNLNEEY
ncbi:hypothetical protein [Pseudoteredinibacter isoporae]|nr:hypothetical protein [Pseudoteredinibacter isoporae]